MALSNMSHLVYITLYGETDGVILSRLDCNMHVGHTIINTFQSHGSTLGWIIVTIILQLHVNTNISQTLMNKVYTKQWPRH